MSDPAFAEHAHGLVAAARAHWQAEGAVEIADAYKWLFQGTLGGEHAVSDRADARAWLEQEWASLAPPSADEPLLVPLRPDRQIVRLHLRPYRAVGGDPVRLLDAFLASAMHIHPDRMLFTTTWHALGEQLQSAPIGGLTLAVWSELERMMAPQGYPAIHHSAAYRAKHRPAYRVLSAPEAARLLREE